ncbi:DUF6988 family protein [Qipengyuania sp. SM2507]
MTIDQHSHSEAAEAALAKAHKLISWIHGKLSGIEMKGDHRHRIPGQLFDLAIEHHAGIVALVSSHVYASAFALVRCEFECFVRGAWLHYCASDTEIETFVEKDLIAPRFGALIDAIEERPEFESKFLSKVKESAWNAMNGYTHGGIHQISRRMQGEYIEPCFEDDSLLEVVQFSGTMALIAFGQIAALAGRDDLVVEADEMMTNGASKSLE